MGNVLEHGRLGDVLDPAQTRTTEPAIDTGTTMLVRLQDSVGRLGLGKVRVAKAQDSESISPPPIAA